MNEGWTCPKCGRGVAPSEKTCDHGGAALQRGIFHPAQPAPKWPNYPPYWWEPVIVSDSVSFNGGYGGAPGVSQGRQ